jgi:hypothetical protein
MDSALKMSQKSQKKGGDHHTMLLMVELIGG